MIESKTKDRKAIWHPELGDRIRYFRMKRGITLESLGLACNYSSAPSMIHQIEAGETGMKTEALMKAAEKLGVPAAVLAAPESMSEEELELFLDAWEVITAKTNSPEVQAAKALLRQEAEKLRMNK